MLQKLVTVYCPTNNVCKCHFPISLPTTGIIIWKNLSNLNEDKYLFIYLLFIYILLWIIYSYPLPICYCSILFISKFLLGNNDWVDFKKLGSLCTKLLTMFTSREWEYRKWGGYFHFIMTSCIILQCICITFVIRK